MSSKEWKITRNGSIEAHLLFYCFISWVKTEKGSRATSFKILELQLSAEGASVFALGSKLAIGDWIKFVSQLQFWDWKVITIFLIPNAKCGSNNFYSKSVFKTNMQKNVHILHIYFHMESTHLVQNGEKKIRRNKNPFQHELTIHNRLTGDLSSYSQ